MKCAIAALCGALFLLGWLYYGASKDLESTKASLIAAEAANESNRAAIARLERSAENTDKILAGWNADRTTLAGVRSAARQAIREAMKDEMFKIWATGVVPADAWRLLREAPDQNGNGFSVPSGGASGGLSGNPYTGKRQ